MVRQLGLTIPIRNWSRPVPTYLPTYIQCVWRRLIHTQSVHLIFFLFLNRLYAMSVVTIIRRAKSLSLWKATFALTSYWRGVNLFKYISEWIGKGEDRENERTILISYEDGCVIRGLILRKNNWNTSDNMQICCFRFVVLFTVFVTCKSVFLQQMNHAGNRMKTFALHHCIVTRIWKRAFAKIFNMFHFCLAVCTEQQGVYDCRVLDGQNAVRMYVICLRPNREIAHSAKWSENFPFHKINNPFAHSAKWAGEYAVCAHCAKQAIVFRETVNQ